ncbi:MAG: argininosuccinate lyase [Candidatus Obscuribacterales bacterium]|nr:argininosuccinate lyase [Candidatus Obscuribacterales bacterium]
MKVLRAGFSQKLDPTISKFVSSAKDDEALIEVDIKGSLAHAKMLHACGLIEKETLDEIIHGLGKVHEFYQNNGSVLEDELEDVHMNVETRLKEIIGGHADHLHTARSRNDQVALDLRLYVLSQANALIEAVSKLMQSIGNCAKKHDQVLIPGYTHMQRAQPVHLSHSLLAFYEMLARDISRLEETIKRAGVSPLGACALAGTSLPIDPKMTTKELGLDATFNNSIDAVLDRDFVMDIHYACTTIAVHLSQMAETLITWMTAEFNFVSLPDNLTTASSLMPQKKNPDGIELVRSKCGLALGELVSVVTILKGLPQGYNRDLQDTKPGVERITEVMLQAVAVMEITFANLKVNEESLAEAVADSGLYATDLLEMLVKKGVPFRQAHSMVSELAKGAGAKGKALDQYSLEEYQSVCPQIDENVYKCFVAKDSVAAKCSPGSTGTKKVAEALAKALA